MPSVAKDVQWQCIILFLAVLLVVDCRTKKSTSPADLVHIVLEGRTYVDVVFGDDPEPLELNLPEQVVFRLFTDRTNLSAYDPLYVSDRKALENSLFDPGNPTKLIIHGLGNHIGSKVIEISKNAYLTTGSYNVIAVGWGALAAGHSGVPTLYYLGAKVSSIPVGEFIGKFLVFLSREGGIHRKSIHLIGHSLGAHAAGIAGATFLKDTGAKLGRITGLDPAAFTYSESSGAKTQLDKNDAEFVDIIHTSSLGLTKKQGHVDFYPYGGAVQPGCGGVLGASCSHSRAYEYYAFSILNPLSFPGRKCGTLQDAQEEKGPNCEKEATIYMGELADENAVPGYYHVGRITISGVTPGGRESSATATMTIQTTSILIIIGCILFNNAILIYNIFVTVYILICVFVTI